MATYRLHSTFRWKAQELGSGHRVHEFDAKDNSHAMKIARTFLTSGTTKISYEFEKLVKVEETIVASKILPKRFKGK